MVLHSLFDYDLQLNKMSNYLQGSNQDFVSSGKKGFYDVVLVRSFYNVILLHSINLDNL